MILSSVLLSLSTFAAPAVVEGPSFVVRAKHLRLEGTRIVDGGIVIVEDGRIRAAGAGLELPTGLPVIEHDGFVSAGLVSCHGYSALRNETTEYKRAVTPSARMIEAFDPSHSDLTRAREAGITTLVLTPWNANVVSGTSAVVKTHGGRVLKDEGHLSLTLSSAALRINRAPTSLGGALAELDRLFTKPEGAFERAASGRLPVLLETNSRDELATALAFAKRHELRGALFGTWLAGDLAPQVAESGMTLIVTSWGPGAPTRALGSLSELGASKVPLAFATEAPWGANESPRFAAALAQRAGVDAAIVWDGLTARGAEVAGVGERVGKLERGYDADLVFWSGDPLDLASSVRAVYVDGALAYEAPVRETKPDSKHGDKR